MFRLIDFRSSFTWYVLLICIAFMFRNNTNIYLLIVPTIVKAYCIRCNWYKKSRNNAMSFAHQLPLNENTNIVKTSFGTGILINSIKTSTNRNSISAFSLAVELCQTQKHSSEHT